MIMYALLVPEVLEVVQKVVVLLVPDAIQMVTAKPVFLGNI